jgi:uncharacterized membrane protein YczE
MLVSVSNRRLPRRLTQLYVGLWLFGVSMALLVRSELGNMPWDVFHQGLVRQVGGTIGTWSIIVGALVLLLWLPLRERPGLGTVSNVVLVGVSVDTTLALMPRFDGVGLQVAAMVSGIVLNAVATALYVGARLGPGPRDGLMTGLVRRTGGSVRLVKTLIELSVVVIGFAMGGTLGPGTVAFVIAIGPLCQVFMHRLAVPDGPLPPAAAGAPA